MAIVEIKVPDIGDFAEVTVIELMVKPGDSVREEQSLITVESDKASMEIPCSQAGVVRELKVKLGDKVAMGSVVLTLEAEAANSVQNTPVAQVNIAPVAIEKIAPAAPAPAASSFAGSADLECDVVVIGGGPGGYSEG